MVMIRHLPALGYPEEHTRGRPAPCLPTAPTTPTHTLKPPLASPRCHSPRNIICLPRNFPGRFCLALPSPWGRHRPTRDAFPGWWCGKRLAPCEPGHWGKARAGPPLAPALPRPGRRESRSTSRLLPAHLMEEEGCGSVTLSAPVPAGRPQSSAPEKARRGGKKGNNKLNHPIFQQPPPRPPRVSSRWAGG